MFLNLKRILMNEADAGGGNGAAAPTTSAEPVNVPQAQGDTVTISKADLAALVAAEATKAVTAVKDSIYAEARRTFAGSKKNQPAPKTDDAPAEAASAAAPLSATEERAFLRGLDRYIATKGLKPNTSQYERAERALLSERPASVESWAADYFDGYGIAQTSTQPAQTQAAQSAQKPVAEHPVSNRGAPPPSVTPIEEIDLVHATESDRAAFIKTKGAKAYVTELQKQLRGKTVRVA
jgi:hypothetical protein